MRGHDEADARFAAALLGEGVDAMVSGDVETGKTIPRNDIEAAVGPRKIRPKNVPRY